MLPNLKTAKGCLEVDRTNKSEELQQADVSPSEGASLSGFSTFKPVIHCFRALKNGSIISI